MKNFIQVFALLVLFTSCTIENDGYDIIDKQENNISENSYKTATVTYDSNVDSIALKELKEELKVQKIVKLTNNEEVWVMNNNEEISYLEDFMMFVDGVLSVEVVEGYDEKDGDTKGGDNTTGEDEKDGDTKGGDNTTGEDEKDGDTKGGDNTTGEDEKDGDTKGGDNTTGEDEKDVIQGGDTTGEMKKEIQGENTTGEDEKDGDTKGGDNTTGEDEKDGDTKGGDNTTGEDE